MKKSKITLLTAAALVLVLACGILLAACNNDPPTRDFEYIFTNDIDTVDSENLAKGASVTAASGGDASAVSAVTPLTVGFEEVGRIAVGKRDAEGREKHHG